MATEPLRRAQPRSPWKEGGGKGKRLRRRSLGLGESAARRTLPPARALRPLGALTTAVPHEGPKGSWVGGVIASGASNYWRPPRMQHGSWGSHTGFLQSAGKPGTLDAAEHPPLLSRPGVCPACAPSGSQAARRAASRANPPHRHPSALCSPLGGLLALGGFSCKPSKRTARGGTPGLLAPHRALQLSGSLVRSRQSWRCECGIPTRRPPRSHLSSGGPRPARPGWLPPPSPEVRGAGRGGPASRRGRQDRKEMRFLWLRGGKLRARRSLSLGKTGRKTPPEVRAAPHRASHRPSGGGRGRPKESPPALGPRASTSRSLARVGKGLTPRR